VNKLGDIREVWSRERDAGGGRRAGERNQRGGEEEEEMATPAVLVSREKKIKGAKPKEIFTQKQPVKGHIQILEQGGREN